VPSPTPVPSPAPTPSPTNNNGTTNLPSDYTPTQVVQFTQVVNSVVSGTATQVVTPVVTVQGNLAPANYSPMNSQTSNTLAINTPVQTTAITTAALATTTSSAAPQTTGQATLSSSLGLDSGTRYNVVTRTTAEEQPKALITMEQLIALQGGDSKTSSSSSNTQTNSNTANTQLATNTTQTAIDNTTQGGNQPDTPSGGGREVRVPMSNNSVVDIVNGGIKLPDGVSQQFFVVESN
jgi:hypothetical protein